MAHQKASTKARVAGLTTICMLAVAVPCSMLVARSDPQRAAILAPTTDFSRPESYEALAGGTATNRARFDSNAFSLPSASLSFEQRSDFFVGNGFFDRPWVGAPASTKAADGLGPLYNARSCQACHIKDGRGHPPEGPDDSRVSMFLRLSIFPQSEAHWEQLRDHRANVIPEPTYGGQLQDLAIPGHVPEGRMQITYTEIPVEMGDGSVVSLRRPSYSISDLGYGPMHPEVQISPRVAPPMIGLGLLEAIPATAILSLADPEDTDGDGISGRPQWVWSGQEQQVMLGRFGWKAGNATIDDQSGSANGGDIGISNPLHPFGWGECTEAQQTCRAAVDGGDSQYDGLEADRQVSDLIAFYSRHLSVPARRDVDAPAVLRGKQLFYQSGCVSCHVPKHATGGDDPVLSGELIWPYTDLLLHDMGEGLADGRPEGGASGREWRTAPLWGIGLTETVNGHTFFLHDGRARSLSEAILWHGGEAEAARERFRMMPAADRDALIAFLESL